MDDKEIAKWREDYIRLEQDYKREVPELRRVQAIQAQAILDLQTAENNEEQRMIKVADMSIERYMKQKGRQLERWTPIIIQLLITAGIVAVAYIGYQGVIAQLSGVLKGITP